MFIGKLSDTLELDQPANEMYVRECIEKANAKFWDLTIIFCSIDGEDEEITQCIAESKQIASVMPILQLILWLLKIGFLMKKKIFLKNKQKKFFFP